MSAEVFDRQRPESEKGLAPTPIERFSLLKCSEAKLEATACAMLDVPQAEAGFPVADYLRESFQVESLNAAEMLLAVRLADGQHNGRLVWAADQPKSPPIKRRAPAEMPPVSTQRRGNGVGGGVC